MVAMAHSHTLGETRPVDARDLARIRAWLLVVAALVFVMVSIGGATRLTGSGLSITEWQPIVGTLPPLSQADWLDAFAKYRQIPQYEHVNRGMSLEAFKVIFWWEWTHRFLGRLIGAVFLLPFLYFLADGRISRALAARLVGIFVLGALQGAVGWYMVRSGLADRIDVRPVSARAASGPRHSDPRCAHLGGAVARSAAGQRRQGLVGAGNRGRISSCSSCSCRSSSARWWRA